MAFKLEYLVFLFFVHLLNWKISVTQVVDDNV